MLSRGERKKVLVIEDHAPTADMIGQLLDMIDLDFSLAPDGPRGLELAVTVQPDLILLDIMMPQMNGIEVCKALKSSPRTKHIPVIIVSVRGSNDMKIAGQEAGAVEHVVKPFDPAELIKIIKKYI
ncbi:MAG: response regulator [Candidatus Saganbacteria bacterium]|nr:response regulator [Candidatus Saganbacteria bacterium]